MRGPGSAIFQIFNLSSIGNFGKKVNSLPSEVAGEKHEWSPLEGLCAADVEDMMDVVGCIAEAFCLKGKIVE